MDEVMDYKCKSCGAEGVRLFRAYQPMCAVELTCAPCLEAAGKQRQGDRFKCMVPAVPVLHRPSFFHPYCDVPSERAEWWYALPEKREARSAKAALDVWRANERTCVFAEIETTGYATVSAIAERGGFKGASVAALAVPLRQLEVEGVLVRFKLPTGQLAWGLAP